MRRETYSLWATTFLLVGLGVLVAAVIIQIGKNVAEGSGASGDDGDSALLVGGLVWISYFCFFPGAWAMAKYKGRSGWWGLLALVWCLGTLVVVFLPESGKDWNNESVDGPDWNSDDWEGEDV